MRTGVQLVLAWLGLLSIASGAFRWLIVRRRTRREKRAASSRTDVEVAETSMNFDRTDVRSFLTHLVSRAPAMRDIDIDACAAQIETMRVDAELSWSFELAHNGRRIPLRVRAVADDIDAIDLYFITAPDMSALIEEEIRAWAR
jgi:hypothetical protein